MTIRGRVRVGMTWWVVVASCAWGQGSTLPAAMPTVPVQTAPVMSVPAVAPREDASRRAQVTWMGGKLSIAAEDSSLNQILREISRVTGMKITGGVQEERVYGSYGPGAAEEVLRTLLSGMGTNMLLEESAEGAPMELALTPRQGGATPPGPTSFAGRGDEREDDLPPQQQGSRGGLEFGKPGFPEHPAAAGNPGGAPRPTQGAAPDTATTAAAATTEQQSPNGVKTPQQIFDQLMQLQKQKALAPPQ